MSATDFTYVVFGVIVLAIIVTVMMFDTDRWITKDLKRGDLYSLVDVASGLRPDGLTRDQARRLEARGMVRSFDNGTYRVTLKGRLALRLRQAVRQTARS